MFIRTDKDHNIVIYPYSLEQFRLDHKNMSLPQALNNRFLATYDVYPVYLASEPEFDNITQFVVRDIDNPYRDTDGEWRYGWVINNKSPEQIQQEFELRKQQFKHEVDIARDDAIYQTHYVQVNETIAVPVDLRKDRPDIQNISGLTLSAIVKTMSNDQTKFSFRGADDVIYELAPEEIIVIGKTVSEHYSSKHQKSWIYKDMLDNATTTQEINDIVIDFEN